mgnify:CR=1 FL=1
MSSERGTIVRHAGTVLVGHDGPHHVNIADRKPESGLAPAAGTIER